MKNIRIEKVGDINFDFPYLEVFYKNYKNPFLDIGITEEKQLSFKIYASQIEVSMNLEEWEYIHTKAKILLQQELKDEDIL